MRLVEKYRPESLDDIVGQDENIHSIRGVLSHKALPHFLFLGPPGTGKTSTAICMAKAKWGDQWKRHFREFNASDVRGIDDVRTRFKPISKHRGERFIFLDEADRMTNDAQHAMRRVMETTPSTVFIWSGNQGWRVIDAIKSRCAIYRFNRLSDEAIARRLLHVIRAEEIKIDLKNPDIRKGLTQLVSDSHGDMRWALNTLEKLIGEKKGISVESVLMLRRPQLAVDAMMRALAGDFQSGKELIEDSYITNGYSFEEIIEELYNGLEKVEDEQVQVRLYRELGEVEGRCRYGSQPLLQLVAFVSYCWIAPRLKQCPALEGEK